MLIAIIGGKLQGVEAVYLAKKAGWETLVIDKNPAAPATGLCDRFIEFEFSLEHPMPPECSRPEFSRSGCLMPDLILPAIEDIDVLTAVTLWAKKKAIPLAFDLDAYVVSNSKQKSDTLFKAMALPAPKSWPHCQFPVVVKPDQASGSQGVQVFRDAKMFFSTFSKSSIPDNLIVQEYMDGPSYSIEVIGFPGNYKALQVTDLGMDTDYDCKRVTAPTQLSTGLIKKFETTAIAIAQEIKLNGIMDVEVILHQNELKLLEIDARLPSQTPMTVYWSTGINMVEFLGLLIMNKDFCPSPTHEQSVLVEHVKVCGQKIYFLGEHIMAQDGPLTLKFNFFGADEAITSFSQGKSHWVATMIFSGASQNEIKIKRKACYNRIIEYSKSILKEPSHDPFKNQ